MKKKYKSLKKETGNPLKKIGYKIKKGKKNIIIKSMNYPNGATSN